MAKRATTSMATAVRRPFRLMALSLVLLAFASPVGAEQQQSTSDGGPRVMRGFVLQSKLGPSIGLIDTPKALAEFVACLPEEVPSKRQPAPANPDPLRESDFTLDFTKDVLVVVVHRDTISAFPEFKGVETVGGNRVVQFDVPNPPAEARPYGWGVYSAVILPKVGMPTLVRQRAVKSDW